MVITSEYVGVHVGGTSGARGDGGVKMRVLVTAPKAHENSDKRYPGILLYSDIFQLTGPQIRMSRRLAGHGFVVATPEIYHRIEPAGTAHPFDDAGREKGLADARATTVAEFDADCRATLDYLAKHALCNKSLGGCGFCIGGHLAFRAALQPDVAATACFYPTGVHDGKLGKEPDAGSLARAGEIKGALLLVYGTRDPHVPEDARKTIADALARAGTRVTTKLFDAEHAFMRDEGPRYDPEATDAAFADAVAFFRAALGS
jgi:carboxymethylenebutenolidase